MGALTPDGYEVQSTHNERPIIGWLARSAAHPGITYEVKAPRWN